MINNFWRGCVWQGALLIDLNEHKRTIATILSALTRHIPVSDWQELVAVMCKNKLIWIYSGGSAVLSTLQVIPSLKNGYK